jgi:hypothetical protein
VVVAETLLEPGRHELTLSLSELALSLLVVVGARPGPRAFVACTQVGDTVGPAICRAAATAVSARGPDALRGTLLTLYVDPEREGPHDRAGQTLTDAFPGAADGALPARLGHLVFTTLLPHAAFGLEIRPGASGRTTHPHVRADLGDPRVERLARAFGSDVVVDSVGAKSSLRRASCRAGVPTLLYEAGELGRMDPEVARRGAESIVNLLVAKRMLEGVPLRPGLRATVSEVVRITSPRTGWISPLRPLGTLVAVGDAVAEVCDATGRAQATLVAPCKSVVLSLSVGTRVPAKHTVARLGRVRATTRKRVAPGENVVEKRPRIGWCEWVAMPDLELYRVHAKIDTGARTSALHVRSMKVVGVVDGKPLLELGLPGSRRTHNVSVEDYVTVRDSGGHVERRPVIVTTLLLGAITRRVRVTLTDRGDMLFPMLVGRTALGEDFVIDAARKHLLPTPRPRSP